MVRGNCNTYSIFILRSSSGYPVTAAIWCRMFCPMFVELTYCCLVMSSNDLSRKDLVIVNCGEVNFPKSERTTYRASTGWSLQDLSVGGWWPLSWQAHNKRFESPMRNFNQWSWNSDIVINRPVELEMLAHLSLVNGNIYPLIHPSYIRPQQKERYID